MCVCPLLYRRRMRSLLNTSSIDLWHWTHKYKKTSSSQFRRTHMHTTLSASNTAAFTSLIDTDHAPCNAMRSLVMTLTFVDVDSNQWCDKAENNNNKKTRIFGRVKYHLSKTNVVFVRMYWYLLTRELELTLKSYGISASDSCSNEWRRRWTSAGRRRPSSVRWSSASRQRPQTY